MKDGEAIKDFSMKLTTIFSSIRSLGNVVEEMYIVQKFLRAITPRFM